MAALVKANAESLDDVVSTALAHEALKPRSALTITLLRQVKGPTRTPEPSPNPARRPNPTSSNPTYNPSPSRCSAR